MKGIFLVLKNYISVRNYFDNTLFGDLPFYARLRKMQILHIHNLDLFICYFFYKVIFNFYLSSLSCDLQKKPTDVAIKITVTCNLFIWDSDFTFLTFHRQVTFIQKYINDVLYNEFFSSVG